MDVDEREHEPETAAAVSPTSSSSLSASVTAVALFEHQSQPHAPYVVLGALLRAHDSDAATACLLLYHMLPVPPAPVCPVS